MISQCNVYDLRGEHFLLDNQLMCSLLKKNFSPILKILLFTFYSMSIIKVLELSPFHNSTMLVVGQSIVATTLEKLNLISLDGFIGCMEESIRKNHLVRSR